MRRGLDWHRREQRAILDAILEAKMTDRQAAIYNIVLDLIYDGAGETPDDPKHIASYLSNVGAAAARTAIQQLVDMGKIYRVGSKLHQKRAETEAKAKRNLSEIRSEIGRLGGVSSGVSRSKSSNNNDLGEAIGSSKREAEKRREDKNGGGGAREISDFENRQQSHVELIVHAMGHRRKPKPEDHEEIEIWIGLGVPITRHLEVVRGVMDARGDSASPPSSIRYFRHAMQRYADGSERSNSAAINRYSTGPSPAAGVTFDLSNVEE